MKQLDKSLERKLMILAIPLFLVATLFFIDILFDLNLNSIEWIDTVLVICALFPLLGFCIAYIRYKCWGMFIVTLFFIIVMILNMSNFFVKLTVR